MSALRGNRTGGRAAPRAGLRHRVLALPRALRLDRLLTTGAVVAAVVQVLVQTPLLTRDGVPLAAAFALTAVQAAAMPLALRRPLAACAGATAAALVLQVLTAGTDSSWPWSPVLIVTECLVLAAAATRATAQAALIAWSLAVASSAVLAAVLRPGESARTSVDLVVFGAIAAAVTVVVLLLSQWRSVRQQLVRERTIAAEEVALRLVVEERARIARELHDVVAHGLSMIAVQASSAPYRDPGMSRASSEEFGRIAAQSRQALDEMRGLLRVLRDRGDGAPLEPQPTLTDLAALVARVADTGADVVLDEPDPGWSAGAGALVELAAYRIVQEAVSNTLRHAPGAPIVVRLRREGAVLQVSVENGPARAPAVRSVGTGHGLVGMRERAASVGGSLDAGADASGGFAVRARLPVASGGAE